MPRRSLWIEEIFEIRGRGALTRARFWLIK